MAASDRVCVGAIADYAPLTSEDGKRSFTVKITRAVAGGLAARLTGIATKEQADELRGTTLWAERTRLPSLPDDEFYHADLIGLPVLDTGGAPLGTVRAIHNHGAGDILEILAPGQRNALLLPFTRAAVPTVDLTARRIIVDLPDEA